MSTEREQTYVQCINCGHIHTVDRKIPMSVSILKSYCEHCGYGKGLNCGYNEMDVMELKDYFLDERYM